LPRDSAPSAKPAAATADAKVIGAAVSQNVAATRIELLVLQPTPFCNIDCKYCYLPARNNTQRMSRAVLEASLEFVAQSGRLGPDISIVWHAGEPLVLPVSYYENAIATVARLMPASTRVRHHFQTNGILIDEAWCAFFARPDVEVGVSIDGPKAFHDRYRVTRAGGGSHDKAMRGIAQLRAADISFHVISVLTREALFFPDEFFEFYCENGISRVCFNIEEIEGLNTRSSLADPRCEVQFKRFMRRFLDLITERGGIEFVREFHSAFGAIKAPAQLRRGANQQCRPFAILSVGVTGDISTFSPELLGMSHNRWGDFVLGNVLTDDLTTIEHAPKFAAMAAEVARGVENCRAECQHFEFCGGGAPANKLFETGWFDTTETLYCRYTVKRLADMAVDAARDGLFFPPATMRQANDAGTQPQ
jgi:uncharacterized protein